MADTASRKGSVLTELDGETQRERDHNLNTKNMYKMIFSNSNFLMQ
jgi:hypothetical protein